MRRFALLCGLIVFSLLLTPYPAQAQGLPAGWGVYPCTSSGGSISAYPSGNGFYTMNGTEASTSIETYPAPWLASLGIAPITVYPTAPINGIVLAQGISSQASAYNYNAFSGGYGGFIYSVDPSFGSPSTGLINGSLTINANGQLFYYFKVSWQGQGTPTTQMPDHIDLLLKTSLTATAGAGYGSSGQHSGLSASATASDGQFNETASALAGDGASSGGVPSVIGYHLVRASVDAKTGIAEVYLNGTSSVSAVNNVAYGLFGPMGGQVTNGATNAGASSSVAAVVRPDSREIRLQRDSAHNETVDANGTVHGDTTYAYYFTTVLNNNIQNFHPNFSGTWSPNPNYIANGTGPLLNITWQWNPKSQSPIFPDNWNSHSQYVDVGTLKAEGPPSAFPNYQWAGKPDAVEHIGISYTATDLRDNATATGNYDLAVHDQYDNWRRVDAKGNLISGSTAGAPGSLDQLGQTTTPLPATPVLTVEDAGTDWTAAGLVGGGVLSGTSIALLGLPDPPTWPIIVLGLAGLSVTTVSSLPPPAPHQVSPPGTDHFDAAALSTAYQNYLSNITTQPGQTVATNSTVDANFYSQLKLTTNPNFAAYVNGSYGTVSVQATVFQQMLNYYFYANQYDKGGLVTMTAPSTVHTPGGYVWKYLWSYAGNTPPPSSPPAGP